MVNFGHAFYFGVDSDQLLYPQHASEKGITPMSRDSLGYVQLEWTCPFCKGRNPGPEKICLNCGAPQPDDVEFHQPAQEELVKDERLVARAKAGPDIHCPYCGARNPAGSEQCAGCVGDLSEAAVRKSGRVLGAHRDRPVAPVTCPFCQTENAAANRQCDNCGAALGAPKVVQQENTAVAQPATQKNRVPLLIIAALLLLGCAGLIFLLTSTDEVTGEVIETNWSRTVIVEAFGPVSQSDWQDAIPAGATINNCEDRYRHTQSEPAPNAERVCGTPYTVDTGTGLGEVVQDCEYQVYDPWCEYEVDDWYIFDEVNLNGQGLHASWPTLQLAGDQREGSRSEQYEVIFAGDGETYRYTTRDYDRFRQYQPGSRWILEVNTFGAVVSTEPLQ
jgi:hypothetical protein